MVLEEQRSDPDDLQSPLSQRKHTLILPAVNLLKKGELSMYFRITLNKSWKLKLVLISLSSLLLLIAANI